MMRSMYSGVSGLRTHQLKMDVIGNNISNVNTVGFKKSQASFQEIFSQTTAGASAPQGGRGGTNPQQVGLGVSMGSIRVIHEPGSAQRTDNPLDFYIGGDGFFVVSGDANFNNRSYTRAGNFDLDRDGNLVTGEGLRVLGYQVNDGVVGDTLGGIKIDKSEAQNPTATTKLSLRGNLDSRMPIKDKDGNSLEPKDRSMTTDTVIYDSLGNPYTVTYRIGKTVTDPGTDITWAGTWDVSIDGIKDVNGNLIKKTDGTDIDWSTIESNSTELKFTDGGKLESPDSLELTFPSGDLSLNGGKFEDKIGIDIKSLTQYGNTTTTKAFREDGETSGVIDSFSVSKSGEIVAVYTNGESKVLSQMALAKFDNPGGLEKEGSNLFKDTRNSGEAQYGQAGGSGYGQMLGGAIEMSNVDLSNEFTDMITTQRGFQANSRIITTSDEMLQELMSLKR